MTEFTQNSVSQARVTILGFACCQGFLYGLFYLILPVSFQGITIPLVRVELFCTLAALVLTFVIFYQLSQRTRERLLSESLFWVYGLILALVSLAVDVLQLVASPLSFVLLLVQCVIMGIPAALLLCAWGQMLGKPSIEQSVPEVFIGSALGAAVCFIVAAIPVKEVSFFLSVLPLASAFALAKLKRSFSGDALSSSEADTITGLQQSGEVSLASSESNGSNDTEPTDSNESEPVARNLNARMLAGTAVFGVCTGAIQSYISALTPEVNPSLGFTLLLFILFCLAALQLFGGTGVRPVRSVFGGFNDQSVRDEGPLYGAYRLALLLMLSGILVLPLLMGLGIAGESVVLAGYLAVAAVLISLFIIMGHIGSQEVSTTFARGLAVLFAGNMGGILLGNAMGGLSQERVGIYLLVAITGVAVLYACLFLFADRDMRSLSLVVEENDRFEQGCQTMRETYGLSNRESEILPMVLRGRTSERVAQELFITKNTVDTHIRRIYGKCGVHNRQELIDLFEQVQRNLPSGR